MLLQNRIGAPEIFDVHTQLYLELPKGLRIFNRNLNTWIGGSENGDLMLHIERIEADEFEIPAILAEEDLDLFLCSINPPQVHTPWIQGVRMSGSYLNNPIEGYLSMVYTMNRTFYIVLVSTPKLPNTMNLKQHSLGIAKRIRPD